MSPTPLGIAISAQLYLLPMSILLNVTAAFLGCPSSSGGGAGSWGLGLVAGAAALNSLLQAGLDFPSGACVRPRLGSTTSTDLSTLGCTPGKKEEDLDSSTLGGDAVARSTQAPSISLALAQAALTTSPTPNFSPSSISSFSVSGPPRKR